MARGEWREARGMEWRIGALPFCKRCIGAACKQRRNGGGAAFGAFAKVNPAPRKAPRHLTDVCMSQGASVRIYTCTHICILKACARASTSAEPLFLSCGDTGE